MEKTVGIQIRGIRIPIIKQGDDLVGIIIAALKKSWETEGYQINDKDVIGITESVVARSQGNYVTIDDISREIQDKFGEELGIVFPILSRNRFSLILKGIARAAKKIHLQLAYPADEVGNSLMDTDKMDDLGLNPATDVLDEADYRRLFGPVVKHPFTGIDYVDLYKDLAGKCNISIYFANDPRVVLKHTRRVLAADVHSRHRTKKLLRKAGAEVVYGLDEICTQPRDGSGYNPLFGLLGSNMATAEKLKLFPRDGERYVKQIQDEIKQLTGKHVEVLIYGDGAFKDPIGKIWELADPVVSPAYTEGLRHRPNELKLKYFADNQIASLHGEEAARAMKELILKKKRGLVGSMESQGTTPRQLVDLLGSLCDLTSGSGDRGTPLILIQGYFDNYATE